MNDQIELYHNKSPINLELRHKKNNKSGISSCISLNRAMYPPICGTYAGPALECECNGTSSL